MSKQRAEYKSITTAIQEIAGETVAEIKSLGMGSDKDKLTSKQIAKKIKKMKGKHTLMGWDKVFAKFNPKELHSKIDLEGMLPDYIAGKDIEAVFAEEIEEAETVAGDVAIQDKPLGKKKDIEDLKKMQEAASMSSINDLVQDIKSKTVVYADVTQGSNQGHKFYLKGKPEIKAGDILLRMDSDKSQFIQIKIDQIKDIRTTKSMAGKNKAVSINLKK